MTQQVINWVEQLAAGKHKLLTFRNWQGELIGDKPYWHKAPAASKLDTFADSNLIINVDVDMEIDSKDDNMVLTQKWIHIRMVWCVCVCVFFLWL